MRVISNSGTIRSVLGASLALALLGGCAARGGIEPSVVATPMPPPVALPSPVVKAPVVSLPAVLTPAVSAPALSAPTLSAPLANAPVVSVPEDRIQALSFGDLEGWPSGDHAPVLIALQNACETILDKAADESIGGINPGPAPLFGTGADWSPICRIADQTRSTDATAFFEQWFIPVSLGGAENGTALFTAYYEPELRGSRVRGGAYQHPLYAVPDDLERGVPYFDRAAIDAGALEGRGLELFWLDDPVESFFLHIQGSGRIRLPDGSIARVGYASKNNRSYVAIGRTLVDWNEMTLDQVSKDSIKGWIANNPARANALLATNPSYVFFQEREELNADPGLGPIGSFGQPLPASRSIAIDRKFYPLGIPMWVAFDSPVGPMKRLTLAMDTGGAIKGARRADFFFGSGDAAGTAAGSTRSEGKLIALTPRSAFSRAFGSGA